MALMTAYATDVGIEKNTNQDSLSIQTAQTDRGTVILAVVCDGMGGLQKGELASANVILAFRKWFEEKLPEELYRAVAEVLAFCYRVNDEFRKKVDQKDF